MLKKIYSYYQSVHMIISMLTHKEGRMYHCQIDMKNYKGLDNLLTPVKIISPKSPRGKTVIIYPGASPDSEQHPKLEMLGLVLAKNGYRVFIPRIPPLKSLDISEVNISWFISFYYWLINSYNIKPKNLAVVGISYGGGLLLKAILQIRKNNDAPKVIMTYGTFADVKSTLNFLISGEIIIDGVKKCIQPNEWGLIVLFKNYLKKINTDLNTESILNVISEHIDNNFEKRDQLISELDSYEREITDLMIKGKTNKKIIKLCDLMLESQKNTIKTLSPFYWCNAIEEKVFIFHGANDSMVPYTESVKLANELPNSELLISYIYEHKEISTSRGTYFLTKELFRMLKFFSKFYLYYEN